MTELSHFEEISAKTPLKEPYSILGGAVLLVIILVLLNALAPNEAVKESKQRESTSAATEVQAVDDVGEEL